MSNYTLKGNAAHTIGNLPLLHSLAPDFILTKTDLSEMSLKNFNGKKIILNIFPSLDTPICSASVRKFNEIASQHENVIVICISQDLPFAQQRFCGAENLTNVITASAFRHPEFGKHYGLTLIDGPLAGLLARCVIIIDEEGKIKYIQAVEEISHEPNYDAVLEALKRINE